MNLSCFNVTFLRFHCRSTKRLLLSILGVYSRYFESLPRLLKNVIEITNDDPQPPLSVICIGTLADECYKQTTESDITGCRAFPSLAWASKCLVLSQATLTNCSTNSPLNPFVALGFFLTEQFISVATSPFCEDATIKFLYDLAMQHYASVVGDEQHMADVIKHICDAQNCMNA